MCRFDCCGRIPDRPLFFYVLTLAFLNTKVEDMLLINDSVDSQFGTGIYDMTSEDGVFRYVRLRAGE